MVHDCQRKPKVNPYRHGENMQTSQYPDWPTWGLKQGLFTFLNHHAAQLALCIIIIIT